MTNDEKNIMADMFYYLRDHNDPPAVGTDGCTAFWKKAAADIGKLVDAKWKNYPLAMRIGVAMYEYLEKKCKAKDGRSA